MRVAVTSVEYLAMLIGSSPGPNGPKWLFCNAKGVIVACNT